MPRREVPALDENALVPVLGGVSRILSGGCRGDARGALLVVCFITDDETSTTFSACWGQDVGAETRGGFGQKRNTANDFGRSFPCSRAIHVSHMDTNQARPIAHGSSSVFGSPNPSVHGTLEFLCLLLTSSMASASSSTNTAMFSRISFRLFRAPTTEPGVPTTTWARMPSRGGWMPERAEKT